MNYLSKINMIKTILQRKKVVDEGCRKNANTEAENKYCDCQFEVLHYNLSKSIGKTYYKKPIVAEDEKKICRCRKPSLRIVF